MKYLVGIDLGTTNTVVYFTDSTSLDVKTFNIPQMTNLGEVETLKSIPSSIYLTSEQEIREGLTQLPWDNSDPQFSVGSFAETAGCQDASRVISSSKSWLCHDGVDRLGELLPVEGTNKISPVLAATLILNHIQQAWNFEHPENLLENQNLTLTVPASFDTVARELTVKAANDIGLEITLVEEPLAAFYSWLNSNADWRESVMPGDVVLVCDVGGGTTDFSLVAVNENDGDVELNRVAVGRHILLGGDNIDLALAFHAKMRFKSEHGHEVSRKQLIELQNICKRQKEKLFNDASLDSVELTLLGSGSSIIANSFSVTFTRDEINNIVLEGFFPQCEIGEDLQQRRGGLRNFGLNYEADPAITKHLSQFLIDNIDSGMPTCVLFNGGVIKPEIIRERIMTTIAGWLEEGELRVLPGFMPDTAVASGSCCYAYSKLNGGFRVKSGSAMSYYIGIESDMMAIPGFEPPVDGLCLVPFGMEEGEKSLIVAENLAITVGAKSEFRFFVSEKSHDEKAGDFVESITDKNYVELSSIFVEFPADETFATGSMILVDIEAILTETGVLQVWCISKEFPENRWKLEFNIRHEN